VFWCLLFYLIWPRGDCTGSIALTVLIATCLLEILQLWHPPLLEAIRATLLGHTLLGTTFSWWDFFHYLLGSVLAWLWMQQLARPST
jgi:hypothetical protein